MSTVKIKRALSKAVIGGHPASAQAMLQYVPAEVRSTLTSSQIATMLDQLWRACQDAKAIAARDAIDEGAIWDAKRARSREIGAVAR